MSDSQEMHEPFLSRTQGDELVNNDTVVQTRSRLAAVGHAQGRAPAPRRSESTKKKKSGNKTKASLDTIMEVSRRLNEIEDARAEEKRQARLREEAEMQRVRDQRWAEIQARMKARNTPLPSARSREECEDDADFDVSNSDSAPLVTRDANGRQVTRKRWEVVTWYQKIWYAVYNFIRYFTLAASFAPGVLYTANDPDIYYRRREYDD